MQCRLQTALFRSTGTAQESICYDTMYSRLKLAYDILDFTVSKATHIFRKSAAFILSLAGCAAPHILLAWLHHALVLIFQGSLGFTKCFSTCAWLAAAAALQHGCGLIFQGVSRLDQVFQHICMAGSGTTAVVLFSRGVSRLDQVFQHICMAGSGTTAVVLFSRGVSRLDQVLQHICMAGSGTTAVVLFSRGVSRLDQVLQHMCMAGSGTTAVVLFSRGSLGLTRCFSTCAWLAAAARLWFYFPGGSLGLTRCFSTCAWLAPAAALQHGCVLKFLKFLGMISLLSRIKRCLSAFRHGELVIARQGNWLSNALSKHYLNFAPIRTMLGLGGVPDSAQIEMGICYWAPHLVPYVDDMRFRGSKVDMKLKAFPFLANLREAIEQVLLSNAFSTHFSACLLAAP